MSHSDDQPIPSASPLRPSLDDDVELTVEPSPVADAEDPRKTPPEIPPPHFPSAPPEPSEPIRYSLRELMALITVAAVLFASMRLIGAAVFAAVAGVLGFVMLVIISVAKPTRGVIHIAWVVLMIVYAVACVAAFVESRH